MKLEFFASPADIKALFHELEEKIEMCYIWGFSVPCPDVLTVFSSCDEIDCFGYALDPAYWIDIRSRDTSVDSNFLSSSMIQFRKCATDIYSYSADAEQYGKYLPIGYWDSDWLLWDLSKPLEQVDEEDESTWALVTFAHDEEWDKEYWAQGGCPCVPDFKTLLEWYFCGTLEAEFEEDNGVKVTRERMRTWDFRWHWYEDRWKEKA